MYLARLRINRSRLALGWTANSYRVHQRLKMACDGDMRLLFRIEDTPDGQQIIVQSQGRPDWEAAFNDFQVLRHPPECKSFDPVLQTNRWYRFRLLANPTVKKQVTEGGERRGKRQGLLREDDQRSWLERKMADAGARLIACDIVSRGLQRSGKNPYKDDQAQTHLAVLFEGILEVQDPAMVREAIIQGIGSAKGYGFGLLSLAPYSE